LLHFDDRVSISLTETQGALKKAEDVLAAETIAGVVARAKVETLEEQLVTAKMRGEEREELYVSF
jgi:hypothetical protein